MYGCKRERYVGREREREGKRGPVSVSLQFRAGVPSHLHMNQDQRSAPRVLKRVCGGYDTRTNNRSQLCKSRCGGVMS